MKLSTHRSSPVVAVALTVLFAALTGVGSAADTDTAGTAANPSRHAAVQVKKKCKRVKKRVHGKVRTVRVCKKVKRRPTLPSRVKVTLDPAHAATTSISAASGGTLRAGGATVTVPAGAVATTTSMTVTPVTRLRGLKGKVVAAVQFQPDGLQFQRPVTLTIDVPSTSGLEAFTYSGNGRAFHLYPLKVVDGKATLTLFHFSGYGVGKGLPGSSVSQMRWWVKYANRWIELAIKDPDIFGFEIAELSFEGALDAWNSLSSAQQDEFTSAVDALGKGVAVALRRLADAEHLKCVRDHNVIETGKDIDRARKSLDTFATAEPFRSALAYALSQREKCERFELDFMSEITFSGANGAKATGRVRVQRLQLHKENVWTNHATLDYWSFDEVLLNPTCSATYGRVPLKPFKAELFPGPSYWYLGSSLSPPPIRMEVDVGDAREDYTYTCPGIPQIKGTSKFWSYGIQARHGGGSEFTINDWSYVGGAVFARRTYSGSSAVPGGSISEHTTFELRHTPQ